MISAFLWDNLLCNHNNEEFWDYSENVLFLNLLGEELYGMFIFKYNLKCCFQSI